MFSKIKCRSFEMVDLALELRIFATSNIQNVCLATIPILLKFEMVKY